MKKTPKTIIQIENLKIELGGVLVHKGINLSVSRGEVLGIVGASGSGKTTLLREMLMLQRPGSGSIKMFNYELTDMSTEELVKIQKRLGVLYQKNALFSGLTVLENTEFPLREHTKLHPDMREQLALMKILLVGLPEDAISKFPSELSGGMQKRAALARAIVLDPELLFLDEPTTGLDPDSASELDQLILDLQATMGLTIVIVTHDLDTLWRVTSRVAFLLDGKVLAVEPIGKLVKNPNPHVQKFFNGPRGRAVQDNAEEDKHGN